MSDSRLFKILYYLLDKGHATFEAPYKEYPITICAQTVILTNGGACCCPVISAEEKPGNHFPLFFRALHTAGNWGMYGRCRSTTGYQIRRTLQLLHKEMEVLSHGESEPFAL